MNHAETPIRRRAALHSLGGATIGIVTAVTSLAQPHRRVPRRSSLGLVSYCCNLLRRQRKQLNAATDLFQPLNFLQYCHTVGAGGMQIALGQLSDSSLAQLKTYAEQNSLFVEAIANPPRDQADVARFDRDIRTARDAGAAAVRTVIMPGRRYEQFKSLEEVQTAESHARQMVERAVPVMEKYRIPLAIENHKDQPGYERVALLRHISSEFIGACVDTGNSLALLEDPLETIEQLAPWAKSVHLKDQAVSRTEEGFLLGDIPLGQGFLPLTRIVELLREQQPHVNFSLELITREPLSVPCLTKRYRELLPEITDQTVQTMLDTVMKNQTQRHLQVSSLTAEQQAELEVSNVQQSLKWAQENLML
ncbi:MAG: sugar phosphate isomerase/epimerase [Planctomycetaceae bacterium]|nr:sugar phosphate isomerase/epimerase [Planctomycetaceae bacterium]